MALLKIQKIRAMNNNELKEKTRELRLEISKEIASSEVGGTVKNPGRIREAKRTVSRILTIQHQRRGKSK